MSPPSNELFVQYARVLRGLVPRARRVDFYSRDGAHVGNSTGSELTRLRPAVLQLLAKARDGAPRDAGVQLSIGGAVVYLLPVYGDDGAVLGVVSLACRPSRSGRPLAPAHEVAVVTASTVTELARTIVRQSEAASKLTAAESVQLKRLLEITQIQSGTAAGGDVIEAILAATVAHLDCDVAVLHIPGRGLERLHRRGSVELAGAKELNALTRTHLFKMAESRGECMIINRLRETPESPLVPYRILCVPLKHRGAVAGLVVAFGARARRPFDAKDAALLEQLSPRLRELVANTYDEQTGLLTRQAFEEQVLENESRTPDQPRCVIYGNLDRLHAVNELFGYTRGDEVLRHVGQIWRAAAAPDGTLICRLSGDRFVALLNGATLNRARAWAERLRETIASLTPPGCTGFLISSSFGVAPLAAGQTVNHALAAAESACKAAKDRGRNRVEVFADADVSLMQRHQDLRIFRDLVRALDEGRLALYAQPLVPLLDPTLQTDYELLVRVLDEDGNAMLPGPFLSAATRYQLLARVDQWVMQEAIRQLAAASAGLARNRATFWINLSGQSLGQADFTDFARTLIKGSGLPTGRIGFEITENAAIGSLHAAKRCIERLHELGCEFALDDFGTGLSSLAYLRDLRVSKLKIDGSFIRDLRTDPRSDSVVRAVLLVARELGLETVAECVESTESAQYVASLGVAYGQGHALGAPAPLDALLKSLATPEARAAVRPPAAASTPMVANLR